jgi:hypothetical protein
MKEKIFKIMIEYGWNLGDNTYEDFSKVYDLHYNRLNVKCEQLENANNTNTNKDDERLLEDLRFITDFLKALNDINSNNTRVCSVCGNPMHEGYCVDNGMEYYCSDECLHTKYTDKEWLEMYDNGNSDSYWTSWEE